MIRWAAAAVVLATAVAAHAGPGRPGGIKRIEHTPLGEAPTRGRPDAPVICEVYFTPGSELGIRAYRKALELWRRHPGRVRLVFRPLLRSDASQYTAPIALAAHGRGRFFALMDELAGQTGPQATREGVLDAAERVGVDRAVAAAAVTDPAIRAALAVNDRHALAARIGQRAELVINRRSLGPTPDDATLEAAYTAALAVARIELAAGAAPGDLPALAARRARCADRHERDRRDDRDPPDEVEPVPPITGWHLGDLVADGTACAGDPPPPGRVDAPRGFGLPRRPDPEPRLLARPLAADGLPAHGPDDAPVVLHVVCNLRSATCHEQVNRARRMAELHQPSVRVVYHPWVELGDDDAALELPSAEVVMCGQRLGDGWELVQAVLGQPGDLALEPLAIRADIDPAALTACAAAPPEAARRAVEAARAAGIAWSPTVVVGQRAYPGGFTDDRLLADLIDLELAPGLLGATIPPPSHHDH